MMNEENHETCNNCASHRERDIAFSLFDTLKSATNNFHELMHIVAIFIYKIDEFAKEHELNDFMNHTYESFKTMNVYKGKKSD